MLSNNAQERIHALAQLLSHPDPSQLFFQVGEIAGDQTYLRHGVSVEPGDVVLDIGANVGVAAAFFAALCGAGLVHSFEPVPAAFALLDENVKGLAACRVHRQGLSSIPGPGTITYYPDAVALSGQYADPNRDRDLVRTVLMNRGMSVEEVENQLAGRYEPETITCELTTISSFLGQERLEHVDLVKIDVERAELDVLRGIEDLHWPRIKQLVVEVHDEDGRGAAIEQILAPRGYRMAWEQEALMRGTSVRMLYARRP